MWKLTLATGILAGTMCVTASAQYPVTQPNATYVPSRYGQGQLPFVPPPGYMPGNHGVASAPGIFMPASQFGPQPQYNQPQLGQPYVGQPYTPNQQSQFNPPQHGQGQPQFTQLPEYTDVPGANAAEATPYFESSIYRSSSYARQGDTGTESGPVESGVELSAPQSPVPSTLNEGPVLLGPDGSSNSSNYSPGSTGTHGGDYHQDGFGSGYNGSVFESHEGGLFGAPPVPLTFGDESCGPNGCDVGASGTGLDLNLQPKWNKGWFFQYDHLLWTFEPPNITTIGDDASERFVTIGGVTVFHGNSLNTSYVDYDLDNGDRFEFGFMDDCDGWIVGVVYGQMHHRLSAQGVNFVPNDPGPSIDQSYLAGYVDANADGIDDDISGNSIHGRHGEDLGTPDDTNPGAFILPFDGIPDQPAAIDFNDLVRYLVTFENFSTRNQVTMTGFELMKVKRYARSACSRLDCFYGVRYLNVEDDFSGLGTGGVLGATHWDLAVQMGRIADRTGRGMLEKCKGKHVVDKQEVDRLGEDKWLQGRGKHGGKREANLVRRAVREAARGRVANQAVSRALARGPEIPVAAAARLGVRRTAFQTVFL